jgi:hypothetical protein
MTGRWQRTLSCTVFAAAHRVCFKACAGVAGVWSEQREVSNPPGWLGGAARPPLTPMTAALQASHLHIRCVGAGTVMHALVCSCTHSHAVIERAGKQRSCCRGTLTPMSSFPGFCQGWSPPRLQHAACCMRM